MRKINFLARVAACAAGVGMLLPSGTLPAGEAPVASSVRQVASDVVLTNGTLSGQYVTSSGAAVEGAKVSVRQAGHEVATTTTDAKGVFSVGGMNSGVYEVTAGKNTEVVRAWDANAAPPSAKSYATIVSGGTVRGQDCTSCNPCCPNTGLMYAALGLGAAGLATGIVGIVEAHNNNKSP